MGCFSETVICDDICLLPGMWSGNVYQNNPGWVEIDTNMHLQLFQDEDDYLTGWIYHTEGIYIIQDEYETRPCESTEVFGNYYFGEDEMITDCLLIGSQCVKSQLSEDSALIEFDFGLGSFTAELNQYEEIGDRLKDDFKCLE